MPIHFPRLMEAAAILVVVVMAAPVAGAAPAAPAGTLAVSVSDGAVTLTAIDAPVGAVLDEVARRAGIGVSPRPSSLDGRVTLELRQAPIVEALERLLRGVDHVLVLAEGGRVSEVRLFPATAAITTRLTPPPDAAAPEAVAPPQDRALAALPALVASLGHGDRAVRMAALQVMATMAAAVPVDVVVRHGLGHEDAETRLAVLRNGFRLPPEILAHHALHDASTAVRAASLERLAPGEASDAVLRAALEDPDAGVRSLARAMLAARSPQAG